MMVHRSMCELPWTRATAMVGVAKLHRPDMWRRWLFRVLRNMRVSNRLRDKWHVLHAELFWEMRRRIRWVRRTCTQRVVRDSLVTQVPAVRGCSGKCGGASDGCGGTCTERVVRDSLVTQVPAVRRAVLGNAEAHPTGAEGRVLQYVVLECLQFGVVLYAELRRSTCGNDGCGGHAERVLMLYVNGTCCTPSCSGKCGGGSDGCGGTCAQRAIWTDVLPEGVLYPVLRRKCGVSAGCGETCACTTGYVCSYGACIDGSGAMFATMASTIAQSLLIDCYHLEFYIDKE